MRNLKKHSYSIWLMPSGRINKKFSKIILELSKKHKSPKFMPHVTLIGGFTGDKKQMLLKAQILANLIKPFDIKLTETAHLNEFYRSLFVYVKKTPELMKTYNLARKLFDFPKKKYMPHLSLIYGNFSKETKERIIIKEIGEDFNVTFRVKHICLGFNNEVKKQWPVVKRFSLLFKSGEKTKDLNT